MFPGEQGMSKPLARGCPSQRWEKGKPFRIQETPKRGASKPRCQANQPKRIRGCRPRNVVELFLCLGAVHFSESDLAYNPRDGLGPAEVDAMFADLAHLHTRLCAPAQHYDDGRVLTVGHGRLATEAI
jgi:hypothetical protein